SHAADMGAELITGRVTTVLPMGKEISVGYGTEILTGKRLILATGIVQASVFPGEAELLGSGVSYCATCDGMLFRGKKVVVVCLSPDAEEEADFLTSIGCQVIKVKTKKIKVNGEDRVTSVTADGEGIPCDGVFILRQTIAPASLIPGLETEKGHIKVDRSMKTNMPGVFAAGDCTGTPYQIAKAAGEGQVAVLSAVEYLTREA
ncbi:MAG: FAD-dependent oxidoreductase, partial [Clostridiales bacterium]|nr:FAD-dependent oxidoreductase [Clostridiales bacterium]